GVRVFGAVSVVRVVVEVVGGVGITTIVPGGSPAQAPTPAIPRIPPTPAAAIAAVAIPAVIPPVPAAAIPSLPPAPIAAPADTPATAAASLGQTGLRGQRQGGRSGHGQDERKAMFEHHMIPPLGRTRARGPLWLRKPIGLNCKRDTKTGTWRPA